MPEVTGLILAAGNSIRFGNKNKLLSIIDEQPLIAHSINSLQGCDQILVIIRGQGKQDYKELSDIHEIAANSGAKIVINSDAAQGMSTSIIAGVNASKSTGGWCILPADMPFIQVATCNEVIKSLKQGFKIAAPYYQSKRGHPVGISRKYLQQLLALRGDTGARSILNQYANDIRQLHVDDSGIIKDIDVEKDLRIKQ